MKRSLILEPDNQPASELEVLLMKDRYEVKPVIAFAKLFDVSLMIMKRFELAIEGWAILPKVNGYFPWMLEDSSIHMFDEPDLIATYAEFKRKVTLRSAYLHIKAQEILDAGLTYGEAKAEFQTIVNTYNNGG